MTRRDLDEALRLLADRQHGVFTFAQAREIGFTRKHRERRVSSKAWTPVHEGVYSLGGRRTWRQRVMAAVLAAGAGAAAVRSTAAALHDVEGWPPGGKIEISVRNPRSRAIAGVTVHRSVDLVPDDCTVIDGIPVTNLVRTLIDLGATKRERTVARAIDSCAAAGRVTYGDLRSTFDRLARRGRDGIALARALLDVRDPAFVPPASELEARVFELLESRGIPRPIAQFAAPWREGVSRERVDGAWVGAKVILECDSRAWHARLDAFADDRRRDRRAARHGWIVVRVTWEDVTVFPDELVGDIRAILRDRLAA